MQFACYSDANCRCRETGSCHLPSWAVENASEEEKNDMANLLWTILVVLVVLWLLGFVMNIGGGLIHLLLVVAVIILVFNLLSGRSTV